MRRTKADAWIHGDGKPLKSINESDAQLFLHDFGCTYRERLEAVEREVMARRLSGEDVSQRPSDSRRVLRDARDSGN